MIYPMPGHPAGVVSVVGPSGMPRHLPLSQDEGEFLPVDEASYGYPQTTPYHSQHHPHHPPHPHHHMHQQYMHGHTPYHPGSTPLPHSNSPTAMMGQAGHPMMQIHSHSPNDGYHLQTTPMPPQQYYTAPPRRPGMQQRHTAMGAPRPPPLQRQYSLQPPPSRAVDPLGQDVFAMSDSTPIRRPSSAMTEYPPESNVGLFKHRDRLGLIFLALLHATSGYITRACSWSWSFETQLLSHRRPPHHSPDQTSSTCSLFRRVIRHDGIIYRNVRLLSH